MSKTLNHKSLLTAVRKALADRLRYQPDEILKRFERTNSSDEQVYDVHVQFWIKGELRASGVAYQFPLNNAIYRATIYALDVSAVEGNILKHEFDTLTIELVIKEQQFKINPPYSLDETNNLHAFRHGLRIETDNNIFDILPSQILREQRKTLRQQLEPLLKKAGMGIEHLDQKAFTIFETRWLHIAQPPNGSDVILRRHRAVLPKTLSNTSITQAAIDCGTRLVNTQTIEGTYLYSYQALANKQSNDNYNVVRLAGTVFSVSMLAEKLKGTELQNEFVSSAHASLRYLLYLGRTTPGIEGGMYIAQEPFGLDSQVGKLGTTALTLLALQFGEFFQIYAEQRRALVNTLLFMQREDGAFYSYMPTHYSPKPRFRLASQNYFPGEALLALCYELENEYRSDIAKSIARAFHYYKRHFEQAPDTAFVLWQTSAWAKFHALMLRRPEINAIAKSQNLGLNEIAEFVYQQADWIIGHQYGENDTSIEEYVGGFPNDRPPHSVSSCYIEAVVRAAGLAETRGERDRLKRYRKSAVNGLLFLQRLQIKKEESFLVTEPAKAVGGISGTLTSFQLRNDRDQHAITAYLATIETPTVFESHHDNLVAITEIDA
ncbi:hypothetical protein ACFL2V_01565 [Pseudomonadota bacterium]